MTKCRGNEERRSAQGGGQGGLHTGVALELNPESRREGACEVHGWAAQGAMKVRLP